MSFERNEMTIIRCAMKIEFREGNFFLMSMPNVLAFARKLIRFTSKAHYLFLREFMICRVTIVKEDINHNLVEINEEK